MIWFPCPHCVINFSASYAHLFTVSEYAIEYLNSGVRIRTIRPRRQESANLSQIPVYIGTLNDAFGMDGIWDSIFFNDDNDDKDDKDNKDDKDDIL